MLFKYLRIIVISSILIFIGGCNEEGTVWKEDPGYTFRLLHSKSFSSAVIRPNIINTVDAIHIYKIKMKKERMLGISELLDMSSIYEERNKLNISKFFESIENRNTNKITCKKIKNKQIEFFHVLALDSVLNRVGYFIFYFCEGDDHKKSAYILYSLKNNDSSYMGYYNKNIFEFMQNVPLFENPKFHNNR